MKYIKKYEFFENDYKDGDIVLLDIKYQIIVDNGNEKAIEFLETLYPIQMIHINDDGYYYIKNKNWYRNFYIEPESILRLATPEEVDDYWIKQNIKKYNL